MHHRPETDRGARRDRLIHERVHDSCKTPRKWPEPAVCKVCGAVFHKGRWEWNNVVPNGATRVTCQACRRMRDRFPAGIVRLSGAYVQAHKGEMLRMIRHIESTERREHPLNRIMGIEERKGCLEIRTTDIHLPHQIAESLRSAYGGKARIRYEKEGYFARADWQGRPGSDSMTH